jgi:hypothetical protein
VQIAEAVCVLCRMHSHAGLRHILISSCTHCMLWRVLFGFTPPQSCVGLWVVLVFSINEPPGPIHASGD